MSTRTYELTIPVRKGERGTTVVYADRFVPDDEKRRARETGDEAQAIPFLKRFTVFNAAQCEGLPEDVAIVAPPPAPGPGAASPPASSPPSPLAAAPPH